MRHMPPTTMPIRANFLETVSVHRTEIPADKTYGRFKGPLSLSGAFPGKARPDVWVV